MKRKIQLWDRLRAQGEMKEGIRGVNGNGKNIVKNVSVKNV